MKKPGVVGEKGRKEGRKEGEKSSKHSILFFKVGRYLQIPNLKVRVILSAL